MESKISPQNIQERSDSLTVAQKEAEAKPAEVVAPETPVEKPVEKVAEVKAPEAKAPEVKTETKVVEEKKAESKQPNDPAELRKWATKASQENAALRDEMKQIKAALDKLSKKPIDYAALAKDPDSIKKHVEAERAEAVAELEQQLVVKANEATKNETIVEKMRMEADSTNYPRWKQLFPLIQHLATSQDGRIVFNNRPVRDVLHDLYDLAGQLSPSEAARKEISVSDTPEVTATPAAAAVPAVPVKTAEQVEAEIQTRIADAVRKAREEAATGAAADASGSGVGSLGKGGKRTSGLSKEALREMPMAELKKMISQGQ